MVMLLNKLVVKIVHLLQQLVLLIVIILVITLKVLVQMQHVKLVQLVLYHVQIPPILLHVSLLIIYLDLFVQQFLQVLHLLEHQNQQLL